MAPEIPTVVSRPYQGTHVPALTEENGRKVSNGFRRDRWRAVRLRRFTNVSERTSAYAPYLLSLSLSQNTCSFSREPARALARDDGNAARATGNPEDGTRAGRCSVRCGPSVPLPSERKGILVINRRRGARNRRQRS